MCEFHFDDHDVESVILKVSDVLDNHVECSTSFWSLACDALSRVGERTWWHCSCGVVSPLKGEMDAMCEKCCEFFHVGQRLSRAPWVLYVQCLRHLYVRDWFERLLKWCDREGILSALLLQPASAAGDAYPGAVPDSGAERAAYGEAIAARGESAYGEAIAARGESAYGEAIAARGELPRDEERVLVLLDGMRVSSSGTVWGTQWIALPMPLVEELEGILYEQV